MSRTVTAQETFWSGPFGDQYLHRNQDAQLLASNFHLFSNILAHTHGIRSIMEFGANIGMNLVPLQRLLPEVALSALEINQNAVDQLHSLKAKQLPELQIYHSAIQDFSPTTPYDLVFTKGVLIHIAPESLANVYQRLYQSCHRYLLVAEYYNPTPVNIPYRGHQDRLFKRDFAGELLDQFSDLRLIAYDFAYHRDPHFPQDDISWFLLSKQGASTC